MPIYKYGYVRRMIPVINTLRILLSHLDYSKPLPANSGAAAFCPNRHALLEPVWSLSEAMWSWWVQDPPLSNGETIQGLDND